MHRIIFFLAAVYFASAPNALAQTKPVQVWNAGADGAELHLLTGMSCPARVGDFQRANTHVFEPAGTDVACNYKDDRDAGVTVYLTLAQGIAPETLMDAAKQGVANFWRNPKPRSDSLRVPSAVSWLQTRYEVEDGAQWSDILMTPLNGWQLKFRATYPPDRVEAVEKFVAEITDVVLATAGKRLSACAAAPVRRENGKRVSDEKLLIMMSAVSGVVIGLLPPERLARSVEPGGGMLSCVRGIVRGDVNYLHWYDYPSPTASFERISSSDGHVTLWLYRLPPSLMKEYPRDAAPPVALVAEYEKYFEVPGFFEGAPDLQTMLQTLADKAGTHLRVNKADRAVTIRAPSAPPLPPP
jgi:hypothetical protein